MFAQPNAHIISLFISGVNMHAGWSDRSGHASSLTSLLYMQIKAHITRAREHRMFLFLPHNRHILLYYHFIYLNQVFYKVKNIIPNAQTHTPLFYESGTSPHRRQGAHQADYSHCIYKVWYFYYAYFYIFNLNRIISWSSMSNSSKRLEWENCRQAGTV